VRALTGIQIAAIETSDLAALNRTQERVHHRPVQALTTDRSPPWARR
jgi:hypothetical protein